MTTKKTQLSMPIFNLLAFAFTGFIVIMTETLPAGLLPQISHSLSISNGLSGQLISIYALGSTLTAVPLVMLTRSWNRKTVLLFAISGLLIFNTITAISNHYGFILLARFIAGMAAGLIWGVLTGYARRLVPVHQQGKALAIAAVGQPITLSIGVPLAAFLATYIEWRLIFGLMSFFALIVIIWIAIALPNFKGEAPHQRQSFLSILKRHGIIPILSVLFIWILGHNILYTYLAPYFHYLNLEQRVDIGFLIFGLFSIIGIFFTGMLIDQRLRITTLVSLFLFSISMLLIALAIHSSLLVFIGLATWGLTFGGAPTLLQTALADVSKEQADIAQSMFVTIFNLAIASGGVIGGLINDLWSAAAIPFIVAALAALACALVYINKQYAFKAGARY